jgi:hypothetical protein
METLKHLMATISLGHSRRFSDPKKKYRRRYMSGYACNQNFFSRNPGITEALEDVP